MKIKAVVFLTVSIFLFSGCVSVRREVSGFPPFLEAEDEKYKRANVDYAVIEKEKFFWPVEGRVISYFGEKRGFVSNEGIDIQSKGEEVVKASLGGEVVFCGFLRGYRKVVITKHPEGMYCVYANLSETFVKKGDWIRKREPLGRVGVDLRKGVYLLHFEIRKGYKAQDPLLLSLIHI